MRVCLSADGSRILLDERDLRCDQGGVLSKTPRDGGLEAQGGSRLAFSLLAS